MCENDTLQVVYCRLEDMHKKWISSQEKHDAEISELKAMVTALSHLLETKAATAQGGDASAFDSSRHESPLLPPPSSNDQNQCKVATNEPVVLTESSHQDARQLFDEMPKLLLSSKFKLSDQMANLVVELEFESAHVSSTEALDDLKAIMVSDLNYATPLLLSKNEWADLINLLRDIPAQEDIRTGYIGILCFDPGGGSLSPVSDSIKLKIQGGEPFHSESLCLESLLVDVRYVLAFEMISLGVSQSTMVVLDDKLLGCINIFQVYVVEANAINVTEVIFRLRGRSLLNSYKLSSRRDASYLDEMPKCTQVVKNDVTVAAIMVSVGTRVFCFDPGGDLIGFLHEKKSVDFGSSFDYRLNSTEQVDWIAYILIIHSNVEAIWNTSFAPSTFSFSAQLLWKIIRGEFRVMETTLVAKYMLSNFKVAQGWYADVAAGTSPFKDFGRKQRIVMFGCPLWFDVELASSIRSVWVAMLLGRELLHEWSSEELSFSTKGIHVSMHSKAGKIQICFAFAVLHRKPFDPGRIVLTLDAFRITHVHVMMEVLLLKAHEHGR